MAQTFRPPATQRIYDVCIVGSQLGGIVAGALLARRGFRVLHVAHHDLGPTYSDAGYVLPWGPAAVPSPRFMPAAEAALAELGLATDVARALEPSEPDLQLLLPKHRVDVSRDVAILRTELRREWPNEAEALEGGFAALTALFEFAGFFLKAAPPLPPEGFGERRTVKKALKLASTAPNAPKDPVGVARPFVGLEEHELVQSLGIAHRFLTYLDGPPSPLSQVRLLGGALRGTHRLAFGQAMLRELIRKRIAESRGELRGGPGEPAAASALEIEGGRVAAVRLADSPDAHVARAFILATDAESARRLVPPGEADAKPVRVLSEIRARRRLFSLNLIVKQAALPPALGENVLALRDPAGGDGIENAIFLQVLPARRDGKKGTAEAVADERVVCASAFLPAETTAREDLVRSSARIREAVADAIPFFERHLVAESAPALNAPAGLAEGARLLAHPLYETELDSTLGITGLPVRGPWKNLFFAGREVIPGLGIEGEFFAGIQAAAHVAAALGRKDVLK
ncbi:NAD(P)-binding protein [Anaeromyxobacter oryzae]|uniref:C-3',4' desaturase CrtD n=1 Tax=Anaeromyxobacter oryzae TaxID=2918170 RepID=A0ABN6N2B7_9BACT|nr:NAD(P)-binding protein [Anaeromyxobacter oryzae]BDG06153.1 C-3',4' desaturase CrtD [Anaeromyxobacter oryzae]